MRPPSLSVVFYKIRYFHLTFTLLKPLSALELKIVLKEV
jgi:hypothetical protein